MHKGAVRNRNKARKWVEWVEKEVRLTKQNQRRASKQTCLTPQSTKIWYLINVRSAEQAIWNQSENQWASR